VPRFGSRHGLRLRHAFATCVGAAPCRGKSSDRRRKWPRAGLVNEINMMRTGSNCALTDDRHGAYAAFTKAQLLPSGGELAREAEVRSALEGKPHAWTRQRKSLIGVAYA